MLILAACAHSVITPPITATEINAFQSSPTSRIPSIKPSETVTINISTPSLIPITPTEKEVTEESIVPSQAPLTISIIYDNSNYDNRLTSDWGFSALVEYNDHTLLFDTGAKGEILMENMRLMGIDPAQIEGVILSHAHGDHTGGLSALIEGGALPTVYLLPSFSHSFKTQVARVTGVIEVSPGQMLSEGIYTTGEIQGTTPEQALLIETEQGIVVMTGCAHPGIVKIVEVAREMSPKPILLVLGGFHLGSKSNAEISAIITDFQRLDVHQVAPCHCTGNNAINQLAAIYGDNFIQMGVGRIIQQNETSTR